MSWVGSPPPTCVLGVISCHYASFGKNSFTFTDSGLLRFSIGCAMTAMSSNAQAGDCFCILPQPSQKSTFGNSSNELRTKAHVLLPNAPRRPVHIPVRPLVHPSCRTFRPSTSRWSAIYPSSFSELALLTPFLLFSILSPHLRRLCPKSCPILYIALSPRCSLTRLYCRLYTLYGTLPYLLCLGLCSVFAAALSKLCSSLLSCQILSQAISKLSIVLQCVFFEFARRLELPSVQRPVRIVQDADEPRSRLSK